MLLILYDATCPLCNKAVRFILHEDKKRKFFFAPLKGETAKKIHYEGPDTLIFVENDRKTLVEGKAVLRICWHLGRKYKLLGILSFLPSTIFDFFYRFVARRRHRLFSTPIKLDKDEFKGRFLK